MANWVTNKLTFPSKKDYDAFRTEFEKENKDDFVDVRFTSEKLLVAFETEWDLPCQFYERMAAKGICFSLLWRSEGFADHEGCYGEAKDGTFTFTEPDYKPAEISPPKDFPDDIPF